jgi:branched-chain amino acid transport system substrate-binding protein
MSHAKTRTWSMVAGGMSLALLAAACGGSSGASAQSGALSGPFVLPVVSSFSGVGAPYGDENRTAYQVAADDINNSGGVDGHQIQFKFYDDQSSATKSAQIIRSLSKSALVVEGPDLTNSAEAMFPVAKAIQLPVMSGSISDATVVAAGQPWTFDTFIPTQQLLPPSVSQWSKLNSVKSVGVIMDSQNAASRAQGDIMSKAATGQGLTVTKSVSTQTNLPSYQAQAASIANTHPDGVIVAAQTNDAAAMVHALRSAGVSGPLLLSTSTFTDQLVPLLGAQIKNVYVGAIWWAGLPGDGNKKFADQYKTLSKGKDPASTGPAESYAIQVIAKALQQTKVLGSNDSLQQKRQKLRDYFAGVKGFQGVNGTFDMSSGGYFEGPGSLIKIDNGQVGLAPTQ